MKTVVLLYDDTYAHCTVVDYNIDVKKALLEHPEFEELICPVEDIDFPDYHRRQMSQLQP